MINPKFIDKNIHIFEGKEAERLLNEKNDSQFVDKGNIKKVSVDRWKEAQEYEKQTWCFSEARGMSTDRNEDHMNIYGGYSLLNLHLNDSVKMIELGSGPFTNLRLIIPQIYKKIKKIDLLDPLIHDYIKHTHNCTYKSGYLASRKVGLISSAIEDFETTEKYDLIVMMNVLEHCRDIDLIIKKIKDMMHENSIFLFHDISFHDDLVEEMANKKWDAGHPIVISDSYMKNIISQFKVLFRNVTMGDENKKNHYLILKK